MQYSSLLEGKNVFITAGASKIGEQCVKLFSSHGARIAIADKDLGSGEAIIDRLNEKREGNKFYEIDLRSSDSIERACRSYLEDFGPPDVWLNCGGIFHPEFIDRQSDEEIFEMIDVNLVSAFLMMKHLGGAMKEKGKGSIIHMVSDYAERGANGVSVYAASKGGLYAMLNSFAMDYAPYGIRVNSIFPGISLTSVGDRISQELGDKAEDYWYRLQLLPRRGRPDEVANVALFLASDMSKLITAEGFHVSGGQNAIAHNQYHRKVWGEAE